MHPSPARSGATIRFDRSRARASHAMDALEDAADCCIFQKRSEVGDVRPKPKQAVYIVQDGCYRLRNLQSFRWPETVEQRVMCSTSRGPFDGEGA
jgi:hypothetical protein